MKKINKSLRHLLGLSVLISMSTTSFAEIIMNSGTTEGGSSISWSSDEVNQLMNDNLSVSAAEPSPPGSATVTTTIRQGGAPAPVPTKPVQIIDNSHFINQPAVSARAALVMDSQTGEVLFSKNTNNAYPIASITKLMTAVVISDARLNMSEKITLQQADFSCAGCKSSSSTLRAGDSMNRAEALLFALMKSENPAAAALA
ncbi:D-alanyl-D-alanine endopeptidase, partial [Escherichia coli]|nr:D-alanyl-D-alanine endopeptidase [Escherichia coli]